MHRLTEPRDHDRRQRLGLRPAKIRPAKLGDSKGDIALALGILVAAHLIIVLGYFVAATCCHPQP